MKEFKGTPGPWFWEGGVLCNKDFIIGGNGGHSFHNKANKDLIAAAPELLEALTLTLDEIGFWLSQQKPELRGKLVSAVFKALGESQ